MAWANPSGFSIETESGIVAARLNGAMPEIDLEAIDQAQLSAPGIAAEAGESKIGYAVAGVPHLVIQCGDVSAVDVVGRGRPLRRHASLKAGGGANVNFVSRSPRSGTSSAGSAWRVRTYERGVEGETLACGSGAVATAILLTEWGDASGPVELEMRSGRVLTVRLERDGTRWKPSLSGEGRVVYKGQLSEI